MSWPWAITRGRVAISFARIAWPFMEAILEDGEERGVENGEHDEEGGIIWAREALAAGINRQVCRACFCRNLVLLTPTPKIQGEADT